MMGPVTFDYIWLLPLAVLLPVLALFVVRGAYVQRKRRLERAPVQSTTYVRYTELFRWPLGLALIALALELGLAARAPVP